MPSHPTQDQTIDSIIAGLRKLGCNNVKATDLSKLLDEDDLTPGLEIMAEVKAYFKGDL